MTLTDPIADMLTQIRNAGLVGHKRIRIPASKVKKALAELLVREGYIAKVTVKEDSVQDNLDIFLKYDTKGKLVIKKMMRVSRPGQRLYSGWQKIPWVLNGVGVVVVSTSQGLMAGQEARKKKLGGELICKVW